MAFCFGRGLGGGLSLGKRNNINRLPFASFEYAFLRFLRDLAHFCVTKIYIILELVISAMGVTVRDCKVGEVLC